MDINKSVPVNPVDFIAWLKVAIMSRPDIMAAIESAEITVDDILGVTVAAFLESIQEGSRVSDADSDEWVLQLIMAVEDRLSDIPRLAKERQGEMFINKHWEEEA